MHTSGLCCDGSCDLFLKYMDVESHLFPESSWIQRRLNHLCLKCGLERELIAVKVQYGRHFIIVNYMDWEIRVDVIVSMVEDALEGYLLAF